MATETGVVAELGGKRDDHRRSIWDLDLEVPAGSVFGLLALYEAEVRSARREGQSEGAPLRVLADRPLLSRVDDAPAEPPHPLQGRL
jgi:hypothetical protein